LGAGYHLPALSIGIPPAFIHFDTKLAQSLPKPLSDENSGVAVTLSIAYFTAVS